MIGFKNLASSKGFRKVIESVFSFIYSVLKFLHLHFALLVVLVGVILYFTGVFEKNTTLEVLFYIGLIVSIFVAVALTVKNILSPKPKKDKRRSKIEIIRESEKTHVKPKRKQKEEEKTENFTGEQTEVKEEEHVQYASKEEEPKFYAVKQSPGYLMAEYSDRYELYYKTEDGLKKVRTDYKEDLK